MAAKLAKLDNLFGDIENTENIIEVKLSELKTFKNHPFKVLDDEAMDDLVNSIKENGILTPATVRPAADGGYELISGHRRKHACERLNLDTMPVVVKNYSDEEAAINMVDSNIQRESLLPSEKAFAYKMKLEALKRKPGRPSMSISMEIDKFIRRKASISTKTFFKDNPGKTKRIAFLKKNYCWCGGSICNEINDDCKFDFYSFKADGVHLTISQKYVSKYNIEKPEVICTWSELADKIEQLILTNNFLYENPAQIEQKKTSVEILAEEVGESRASVQRLIRLTELITPLLDLVDAKKIPINVGVELSYLSDNHQQIVLDVITDFGVVPDIKTAKVIRKAALQEEINATSVYRLINNKTKKPTGLKFQSQKLNNYFNGMSASEIEDAIIKLIEEEI